MSTQPNVRIYQRSTEDVKANGFVDLLAVPRAGTNSTTDAAYIQMIRAQPLPNDIQLYSFSDVSDEIEYMVKLLGAACQEDSIDEAKAVIDQIHEKLNSKEPPLVRSWVNQIKGLHPKIDQYIENKKAYFKNPFSEVMGTNTILYYADTSSIDIWYWGKNPTFKNSRMEWFLTPWPSPSYIRESMRQKLPDEAVEYMMNAQHVTTKLMRRNVIFDSLLTTEDGTGAPTTQVRPIDHKIAHGAALNNDWYHQNYRILDGERNKYWGKHDAIYKLDEPDPGGYFVHVLVNHLTPLVPFKQANDDRIKWEAPLGVEETFPRNDANSVTYTGNNGQKINPVSGRVNDKVLKPESVELPEQLFK